VVSVLIKVSERSLSHFLVECSIVNILRQIVGSIAIREPRQSSPSSETCLIGRSALNRSSIEGAYLPTLAAPLHLAR
jgi:hypothetical protein